AADGHPGVRALVYIASFNLDVGESTSAMAAKFPGGQLGPALNPVTVPIPGGGTATDLYIKQDEFPAVFAADVPLEVAELMAATQRPITAAALDGEATKAAWKTIPSWTMITTQDLAIPAESMRFMAERAGSHTVEIDASHAVTVSEPDAVAELIDKAARGELQRGRGAPSRTIRPRRTPLIDKAARGRHQRDRGVQSRTTCPSGVPRTAVTSSPAAAASDPYSSTVRSRPPLSTSIRRFISANMAGSSPEPPWVSITTTRPRGPAASAHRRRISRAS